MIELILAGDYARLLLYGYIVLGLWVMTAVAVCVVLWAGTVSARARGEKILSGGLRRTFAKLGDYWRVEVMALLIDLIGSLIPWYNLPFASMLMTAGVILIEGRSVWENERAKRSNIAQLPDALRAIIHCTNIQEAEELLEKLQEEIRQTNIPSNSTNHG